MGPAQRWPKAAKQIYLRCHIDLFGFGQTVWKVELRFFPGCEQGLYLLAQATQFVIELACEDFRMKLERCVFAHPND
jgi:hypothetical protein